MRRDCEEEGVVDGNLLHRGVHKLPNAQAHDIDPILGEMEGVLSRNQEVEERLVDGSAK